MPLWVAHCRQQCSCCAVPLLCGQVEVQGASPYIIYSNQDLCSRQIALAGAVLEYDLIQQPTQAVVAKWLEKGLHMVFYPHVSWVHNTLLMIMYVYQHRLSEGTA